MEQIISEEEIKKLMDIKGEVRGVSLKADGDFILKEKGEEGLKRLEAELVEIGHPIKFEKIRLMDFYPIGLKGLTLLAIKKVFNFDDKKFQEMGSFGIKISLIIRVFIKYFVSLKVVAGQVSRMWGKYFTIGSLKIIEINEENRYLIIRLENFRLCPVHCQYLKGYFSSGVQMVIKDKVTSEETKCPFRDDDYHEFLLKW